MTSKPSSPSKRLKKLAAEIPPDEVIHRHLSGLEQLDFADHAVAMMAAGLVEKALEVAILSRLAPMDNDERKRLFEYDHRGPLADLSARILFGKALGLYGPHTFSDLTRIREIRNAFAHALWYIHFNTQEVADMCDFNALKIMTLAHGAGATEPRTKFINSARFIASALKQRILISGLGGIVPHLPPRRRELP